MGAKESTPEPRDLQRRGPTTEDEHRIHALNIQGQFFERWCEEIARSTERWRVQAVDEPLEAQLQVARTIEGTVDLLIERGETQRLTVPIEVKKANPDLVHWVFFPTRYDLPVQVRRHRRIASGETVWHLRQDLATLPVEATACSVGRELRGDYAARKTQNWTLTSNTAIREAAMQVATADRILVWDDWSRGTKAGLTGNQKWPAMRVFIPMIVTTAELFLCRFDPAAIDPASGELPWNAATFEAVPQLVYEYPLPPRFQLDDEVKVYADGSFERSGTRLNIVVVNSRAFQALLRELADDLTRTVLFSESD
jgi:hypothetical protein